ncbi:MAG: hypothetical protein AAGB23_10080 [Pseudomonadota bacterium]
MPRFFTPTLLELLALGLGACNPVENIDEAADQIDRFQSHFSYGDVDEMYLMASPSFRKSTSLAELRDQVGVISLRLGPVETTERTSFNINTTPAGTRTVITMQTRFEQGEGVETYTFVGNGENMRLEGWNVNSNRLMITADDMEALQAMQSAE